MNIDPTLAAATSQQTASTQTQEPKSAQDEFLRLLVAQLEQQNPLNPQDGAEFVAQLAQFTAVEQSVETNRLLDDIRADQVASAGMGLAGLVGHDAVVAADSFEVTGEGSVPPVEVELDDSATSFVVEVLDENGRLVEEIDVGPHAAGTTSVDLPPALTPGNYSIQVRASDANGEPVESDARFHTRVTAVDYRGLSPRLLLGGVSITPADIESIE